MGGCRSHAERRFTGEVNRIWGNDLSIEPDYADAHFNLALLLTRLERCADALSIWERFLELEPSSGQTSTAQKAIALCRMHIQQERTQTG